METTRQEQQEQWNDVCLFTLDDVRQEVRGLQELIFETENMLRRRGLCPRTERLLDEQRNSLQEDLNRLRRVFPQLR